MKALMADYREARREEDVARARRALALRALAASGTSQREIAAGLGISQPAVSQQLSAARSLTLTPDVLLEAAGPVLAHVARERGFTRLAVFGSFARGEARTDSDVDLLAAPPPGTSIADVERLREVFERVLGRSVDLVTYGGLDADRDADILAEARAL